MLDHAAMVDGECLSFNDGLTETRAELLGYALRITRKREDADDLVQETMSKALANREKFTLGTNQRAWLFRILKNLFLSEMRRRKVQMEFSSAMSPELETVEPNQEDAITLSEVMTEYANLSADKKAVVKSVCLEGLSYAETADALKCEVGTVKSRLSRARTLLASRSNYDGSQGAISSD